MRVCSADNNYICFKALTVIYSRINLYLEVALSGQSVLEGCIIGYDLKQHIHNNAECPCVECV